MHKRANAFTMMGHSLTLVGPELKKGDKAPDFKVHKFEKGKGLVPVSLQDALQGKPALFSVVPSLDTPVCSVQTQKFNKELAAFAEKLNSYTVSLDLPFAMNRFCSDAAHTIDQLHNLSDYMDRSFGTATGTLIDEVKLLSRAVFVVDKTGTVAYAEYVGEAGKEPNYEAALKAIQSVV
ncbi:MAG: thiol peroxidase [Planctomycetia bacterium]|nr:thiol peroxidase [Planctomycetia bacterium]